MGLDRLTDQHLDGLAGVGADGLERGEHVGRHVQPDAGVASVRHGGSLTPCGVHVNLGTGV